MFPLSRLRTAPLVDVPPCATWKAYVAICQLTRTRLELGADQLRAIHQHYVREQTESQGSISRDILPPYGSKPHDLVAPIYLSSIVGPSQSNLQHAQRQYSQRLSREKRREEKVWRTYENRSKSSFELQLEVQRSQAIRRRDENERQARDLLEWAQQQQHNLDHRSQFEQTQQVHYQPQFDHQQQREQAYHQQLELERQHHLQVSLQQEYLQAEQKAHNERLEHQGPDCHQLQQGHDIRYKLTLPQHNLGLLPPPAGRRPRSNAGSSRPMDRCSLSYPTSTPLAWVVEAASKIPPPPSWWLQQRIGTGGGICPDVEMTDAFASSHDHLEEDQMIIDSVGISAGAALDTDCVMMDPISDDENWMMDL